MIGRLYCWLIRACGGAHKERRLTKAERVAVPVAERFNGFEGTKSLRRCTRCGATRLAASRKRKVSA